MGRRLYVGNLPYETGENDLQDLFARAGTVETVKVMRDMATGRARGFAFVAYPAEYRSSGVMTFIVNQDGLVYEKDLGAQTADIAQSLRAYDPDQTWRRVE